MKKINSVCCMLFLILLPIPAIAEQPVACLIKVKVTPSQKYAAPKTEYTTLKNDGSPMLLIGIEVLDSQAIRHSNQLNNHRQYCQSLVGQQQDAYLSGWFDSKNITIKVGDQLTLKHIHSSGKKYPFWADFYYVDNVISQANLK